MFFHLSRYFQKKFFKFLLTLIILHVKISRVKQRVIKKVTKVTFYSKKPNPNTSETITAARQNVINVINVTYYNIYILIILYYYHIRLIYRVYQTFFVTLKKWGKKWVCVRESLDVKKVITFCNLVTFLNHKKVT